MRMLRKFLSAVAFAAVCAYCGEGDEIEYKFQYYTDDNRVDVITNTASVSKKVNDHVSFSLSYLVDAISGASRRDHRGAPPATDAVTSATKSVDAVSSATKTDELRHQPSITISYLNDYLKMMGAGSNTDNPATLSITGMDSKENDYTSRTVSAALSQDLFERNTTIGLRVGKSFNQFQPVSWFIPVSDEGWNYFGDGKRQTDNISASFTQGLTTTTIAMVIVGYVYDRGYLARPYYVYKISDIFQHEVLPTEHRSMTITGKLNQYFAVGNGLALHVDYRYYKDSWDQKSNTVALELHYYVTDKIILKPSYRLYSQSTAFFCKDAYSASDRYLTTDIKYRGGNASTAGLKVSYELKDFVKPEQGGFFGIFPVAFDVGVDYYRRDSPKDPVILYNYYQYYSPHIGFKALWVQSGLRFAF